MARRRSLNRRWSRRSGNITGLDQDSEVIDTDNPAWWKDLPDATLQRHSLQISCSETMEPILNRDSLADGSELQDRWWDNLERTNLQSSRRFSIRQSAHPENPVQESFESEDGNEDVSIKKRKVVLRARSKKSGGTEVFLKAFDDSDVAKSEPVPGPTRTEVDAVQRKIRTRSSRSFADADSPNASNDADVVVKARPGAFKRRLTKVSTNVYDEILSNPGPSGANVEKNAPEIEAAIASEKVVDSNDSGDMGPPFTETERKKRLSTVSRKLDLTSDDSEGDARPSKLRRAFQKKSKENASFNPFDEILSSQLDESTPSGAASNASGRVSNAATRMSKSLKHSQTLRDTARAESHPKNLSASWLELRPSQRTVVEEAIGDEETQALRESARRSSSVLNENSRIAKKRARNTTTEEPASSEWDVPETQDEPKNSSRRSKNATMIDESMSVEKSPETRGKRSSSVLNESSRGAKRRTRNTTLEEDTAASAHIVPETQEDPETSIRRTRSSTVIAESLKAEQLLESQEKDRRSSSELKNSRRASKRRTKASPILEATMKDQSPEHEENKPKSTSTVKNTRNSKRSTSSRSRSERSMRNSTLNESKRTQLVQDWDSSENEQEDEIEKPTEPSRNDSRFSSAKKMSEVSKNRSSAARSRRFDDNDEDEHQDRITKTRSLSLRLQSQAVKESAYELPDKERSASIVMSDSESPIKKLLPDTSVRKSSSTRLSARQLVNRSIRAEKSDMPHDDSDGNVGDDGFREFPNASVKSRKNVSAQEKSASRKTTASTSVVQQQDSDQSISEELAVGPQSPSDNLSVRSSRVGDNIGDHARAVSRQSGRSDEDISEDDINLGPLRIDVSVADSKSSTRSKVSRQRIESDHSVSEGESNSKSMNPPQGDKSAAGRRSSARPSVPRQLVESDESDPEGNDENMENRNLALDESSKRSNRNEPSSSALENIDENTSSTVPSESIPLTPALTKLPQSSILGKNKTDVMQKTITDFFPSRHQPGRDLTKALERFKNFDREKTALLKEEMDKQRQLDKTARVKQLTEKKEVKKSAPKKNVAKPTKVVDKAYIVNGQVYKKPKLPRPKPWVTDRLYRHLWKRMESKCNLRTRVKSERFVEQLAAVVALTIRRKKYENYKDEVDALMREMARLDIIKTRNDFYDFCYDYLPYDFRVKVTPMLHPGNVRIVPYDPATLHTPILSES